MNSGWVSFHRKFKDWEWYKDVPVKTLFQHCILMANFKDKEWRGQTIKRGSFITSYSTLANETGLTERQVRTALTKLKMTNELSHEATNKYSIITVLKYNRYQQSDKQEVTQKSDERQTNDNQSDKLDVTPPTTTNNYNISLKKHLNKENNVNNDINTLLLNACELIKEEFRRPLEMDEVRFIQKWVYEERFTYSEIFDALFYTIKSEGHRDDLPYMYGILKNRRAANG